MSAEESKQEDIAQIEQYAKEFSGSRFLLPDDKEKQKEIVERAVFWLLSGMYPDTAEIASDDDGSSKLLFKKVREEANKKAEEFADYGFNNGLPWEVYYSYWQDTHRIADSVSVESSDKLPNLLLRVGSAGKDFVCEGLVGLSEKAFEPIQATSWERSEPEIILKTDQMSRVDALKDLKTVAANLELNFDELSKQMRDLALFEFYVKNLRPGRADDLLKDLNGGEIIEGQFRKTISEHVDSFWEKLTEEEKNSISGKEKILFLVDADTINNETIEGAEVTTSVSISLANVPCRIDESGDFTIELDNAQNYRLETSSTTKVDRDTTPNQLAMIKLELNKRSDSLTEGADMVRGRFKVE